MKHDKIFLPLNWTTQLAALVPAIWLGLLLAFNRLGANPVQTLEQRSGDVALILLLVTLACTPLRILTGYTPLNRLRRTLGLYTFAYAALHMLLFVGLDYGFAWADLWPILLQKRYIWFGLGAFVILLLLALTSSVFWQRKLKKNWQRLHALIYLAAPVVILHFALSLKGDLFLLKGNVIGPLAALIAFALLMLLRFKPIRKKIAQMRTKVRLPQIDS